MNTAKLFASIAATVVLLAGANSASAGLTTYTAALPQLDMCLSRSASTGFATALGADPSGFCFVSDPTNTPTHQNGGSYSSQFTLSTKPGTFGGTNSNLVNDWDVVGPYDDAIN